MPDVLQARKLSLSPFCPFVSSRARQAQIRVLRDKETEETKGHLRAPACYLSFLVYLFKSSHL